MNSMNWDKTIFSKSELDAFLFARQTASNDYQSVSNSTENGKSAKKNASRLIFTFLLHLEI